MRFKLDLLRKPWLNPSIDSMRKHSTAVNYSLARSALFHLVEEGFLLFDEKAKNGVSKFSRAQNLTSL